ncbi:hypothetical protein GGD66_005524 [Bradyrhizobium sp. CIR48]|nr:hypothetical protein [Bradyrhizobium sp. CIR48]
MFRNPDQRGAQSVAKLRHNMRSVTVVPADSTDEVGAGRLGKKKSSHLSRPTIELSVNILPRDCVAEVHVETRQPPFEFGLVRRGQGHVSRGEAVPKLTDEVEPLSGRQTADVERCHDPNPWPFCQRNHNLRSLVEENIVITTPRGKGQDPTIPE